MSEREPLQQRVEQPSASRYLAPWERVFDKIALPFDDFIHKQASGGIVLMVATVAALAVANSPFAGAYQELLHLPISVGAGSWMLEKSLQHWINDGLMALFFFLVGLEIKREVLVGELAGPRQAALPIIAALGGMVVPALLYWWLNPAGEAARGWGIPIATDIAFAIGVLALLGSRVPRTIMMFLVAIAIVDDLGAVLVIALFYTENIVIDALLAAAAIFAVLVAFNRFGVRRAWPYFLMGVALWLAMLASGVHATLAGILVAVAIPARPTYNPVHFAEHMRRLMMRFEASHQPGVVILANAEQGAVVQTLESAVQRVATPLQRLEHAFHIPVAFGVIPVFALANAGVAVELAVLGELIGNPVTLGVMVGLVVGKVTGIAGFCWLAIKCRIAVLPPAVDFRHLVGVGILAGIGFTMSIFVAELAFGGLPEELALAKLGILIASLTAGTAGYFWMRWALR